MLAILSFGADEKSEERREAGVGFAIKLDLVGKLSVLQNGINDRLITLQLPFSGNYIPPSSVVIASEGVGKCNSNGLLLLR